MPFPATGDLPNPGIKSKSLASLPLVPLGKPQSRQTSSQILIVFVLCVLGQLFNLSEPQCLHILTVNGYNYRTQMSDLNHKLESRLPEETSITSNMQMIPL